MNADHLPDNILEAPAHRNPYPYYAGLVAGPALVFDAPRQLWIASSAAAVEAVLGNRACHVRPSAEPVPKAIIGSPAGEVFGYLVRMNEGIRHDAPRLALQRFLAGFDLDLVRQRTQVLAQSAIGNRRFSASSLSPWAFDVPVMAVAELLGFDEAALPQVALWTADFVACLSPLSTADQLAAASDAARALLCRFSVLTRGASSRPQSALERVQCEAAQSGWHDTKALLANLVGLLSQTFEATAGLIGNGIVALATQPGLLETVGRESGKLLEMVSEVSRHDPSVHTTRRFVSDATQVAGVSLQPGDTVVALLAAAGRDPLRNPRPDEFCLERSERYLPGFGHGAHRCPGQALACAIAAAALKALLESGKLKTIMPREWRYRPSVNARIPVFAD